MTKTRIALIQMKMSSEQKKNNSSKINLILLKRIGAPIISKSFNKNYLISFLKKELSY